MTPKKLILKCGYSLGDIVMLTAAVRDMHRQHPGRFLTDVRTPFPALWEHNPYITPMEDGEPEALALDCTYPLINRSNEVPYHCLHGFAGFLSERLGVHIPLTEFKGDMYISDLEKSWMSQVHELTGQDIPFWIIVAGGKFDITIKWWDRARYQQVVDAFAGRIQFVQVGTRAHYHPPLRGVIDLRGKTDLRQLIRLVYHAEGVLCPVTSLMHLAAAVEVKDKHLGRRACVVVAGAREPAHWEKYPHHQFIHTNGAVPCGQNGGCWKARTFPLHDGDERDQSLCSDVRNELPRCMDLITAEDVIHRIQFYYNGGALDYLTLGESQAAAAAVEKTAPTGGVSDRLTLETARFEAERFVRLLPPYPSNHTGQGVVICGGGPKYFPCAYVCIRMLRHLGCELPVQLWHLGPGEVDAYMRSLVAEHGVECVDALELRKTRPARILNGWELKAYALLHSPFREVLLLDADNVPLLKPEKLFELPEYRKGGAVFWPDYGRLGRERLVWQICGVPYRDEPEFESGQILVDKARCWKALQLSMWYNEHSDFFYKLIHGDKDTFHFAFRKTQTPYEMPSTPIYSLEGVMCQHDFQGNRIFQHRNSHKFSLKGTNRRLKGFLMEDQCLAWLEELGQRWDGGRIGVT